MRRFSFVVAALLVSATAAMAQVIPLQESGVLSRFAERMGQSECGPYIVLERSATKDNILVAFEERDSRLVVHVMPRSAISLAGDDKLKAPFFELLGSRGLITISPEDLKAAAKCFDDFG